MRGRVEVLFKGSSIIDRLSTDRDPPPSWTLRKAPPRSESGIAGSKAASSPDGPAPSFALRWRPDHLSVLRRATSPDLFAIQYTDWIRLRQMRPEMRTAPSTFRRALARSRAAKARVAVERVLGKRDRGIEPFDDRSVAEALRIVAEVGVDDREHIEAFP